MSLLLYIYTSVVDARCWLDCAVTSYRPLEPYCHLNFYFCNIRVIPSQLIGLSDNEWNRVRLVINVTNSVNGIDIRSDLADYKLEISAIRIFPLNYFEMTKFTATQVVYMLQCIRELGEYEYTPFKFGVYAYSLN